VGLDDEAFTIAVDASYIYVGAMIWSRNGRVADREDIEVSVNFPWQPGINRAALFCSRIPR